MPALITKESNNLPLILVVDKIGIIGEALAEEFSKDYLVILVSAQSLPASKNIVHIPFKRKIPQVPDNKYLKIFIIDDGESITKKFPFSFIGRARENNAPLYFIASLRNIDVTHAEEIVTSYSKAKVLIFGDLFDKKILFDKSVAINRYISSVRKNSKIDVAGNGLSLSFPITFSDTIKLIVKASYLDIHQKIILLFCPHPTTDISLAHIFQKLNPNVAIDYVKETSEKKIYIPEGSVHALSKYNLLEKIKELNLEEREQKDVKVAGNEKKRSIALSFIFVLFVAVFLINLPILATSFYSFLAARELGSAKSMAEGGDFENALKKARNSKTFFETAGKTAEGVIFEAELIGKEREAKKLAAKQDLGKLTSAAFVYFLEGGVEIKKVYANKSKDPGADFLKASNSFKSGLILLQKVKISGQLPKDFEEALTALDPIISLFASYPEILVNILGFVEEKTYLVLFQDSTKLRPGGGIIESFAIIKVRNGKITDFELKNVDKLNAELKGRIEPPFAVRRYLSIPNLYLQDSNFEPDFVKSAISASNIYSMASKNKVDGVIGTDLFFLKNLLSTIGQVRLSPSGKKITPDNLFEEVSKHENKDFLGDLAVSLENELKVGNTPYLLLLQNIGKGVLEKHLTFAFEDKSAQSLFTANGWSASLWDNREEEKGKINDYLGISEANLGDGYINFFISRSVSKKLLIYDDGRVSSKLTIAFKNNSTKDKLEGNYKNYLQLILPEGSKITSIFIDNEEVSINDSVTDPSVYEKRGFRPPAGIEVEGRKAMGKSIFGFLISVEPNLIKTVTVSYDLPYSVSTSAKSVDYSLKVFKQPGTMSYPFDFTFSIPITHRILGGKETNSLEIRSDEQFTFTFAQK